MNTIKKITIQDLNTNTVVVLTRTFVTVDDQVLQLGPVTSVCYNNCPYDRDRMKDSLPEQYANAILAVWGDEPILEDPKKY